MLEASFCTWPCISHSRSRCSLGGVRLSLNQTKEKHPPNGECFSLVTSVVQTWNTLLEDLEKIDVAVEEYLNEEER